MFFFLFCTVSCTKNPETSFNELVSDGNKYFAQRKYKKAIASWDQALEIQPESVGVLKNSAEAYLCLADFSQVENIYLQILNYTPKADDILLELIKLRIITGRVSEAVGSWNNIQSKYPDDHFVRALYGDLLVLQGRFPEAENVYKNAISVSTGSNILFIKLAICFLAQDKMELAQETFEAAMTMKTGTVDELLQISNFYKLQDDTQKAVSFIRKAIQLEPENLSLQMRLAQFYFNNRQYKDSKKLIEKQIELSPENRMLKKYLIKILLAQNQLEDIPPLLEEYRGEMNRDIEYNFLAGKYYLFINHPILAEEHFKRVTRENPDHFLAHYFLGITYLLGKHVYLGQQSLIKALFLNPSFIDAEIALASVYYKSGKYDFSYDHIKRVLDKEPGNYRAYMITGGIRLAENDYDNALIAFRSALALHPESDAAFYYIALTNELMDNKESALDLYKRLLKKNSFLVDAAWRLKELLLKMGKIDDAVRYFESAVQQYPENGYHYHILGEIYLAGGNSSQAEDSFRKSLQYLPKLFSPYMKLNEIYSKNGKLDAQLDILDTCIKNIPDFIGAYIRLAALHNEKGNKDESIRTIENALVHNPDSALLKNNLAFLYLESDQDINKAFELARAAYEKIPKSAAAADSLGWAYYKKKMYAQSVMYLENALSLEPGNLVILSHLESARAELEDR